MAGADTAPCGCRVENVFDVIQAKIAKKVDALVRLVARKEAHTDRGREGFRLDAGEVSGWQARSEHQRKAAEQIRKLP